MFNINVLIALITGFSDPTLSVTCVLLSPKDVNVKEDGSTDYRSEQQFSDHIQNKSEAVSSFARSKNLRQQKEFLPIFAVRQQVGSSF